ncbi:MAG: hypothetical protein EOO07_10375 [Chitinophagaceae bacterium]|nr:MAG: hypothetical protein EOO07_10375 [Chitinophagaceae bacterium]
MDFIFSYNEEFLMITKNYFTSAVIFLTIGTLVYCNHNVKFNETLLTTLPNPQLSAAQSSIEQPAAKFQIESKQRTSDRKTDVTRNTTLDTVTAKANPEKIVESPSSEITETRNTENNPPEPTSDNADMPATGEFADQVNLQIEKASCEGTCADNQNVNALASGEFSDQINPNEIMVEAKNKGLDTSENKPLQDVAANSHPPTEQGVYTPPIDL